MRSRSCILPLVCVLFALAFPAMAGDLSLAPLFQDEMVVQRDMPTPVWGKAAPGAEVTVRLDKRDVTATAGKDGRWMARVKPPKTGGPYEMRIASGDEEKVIRDILVGEVWICSGQSNMEWPVRASLNPEKEIAAADYPDMRIFRVTKVVSVVRQDTCEGTWEKVSPGTIGDKTAVGYFFGRKLHQELGVPVGLIQSDWGGTPAESWTHYSTLEADPDFQPILTRWQDTLINYKETKAAYDAETQRRAEVTAKALAEGKPKPDLGWHWPPPGPGHPNTPGGLYNAMIAPLVPYAVRGVAWYQGESNAQRAHQYRSLFPAMIEDWREAWGQEHFYFHFVQIANFGCWVPNPEQPEHSAWAELREAQTMTLSLPETAMAVTIDVGEADEIHPANKQDVGLRLALPALANIYGKKVASWSGPIYRAMEVDDGKVILTFDHADGGLKTSDGEAPKMFSIAGENAEFVWAKAKIVGDKVQVWADSIPNPVAVRYGWANDPDATLQNGEGLPASPFRTDTWPVTTTTLR